MASRWTGSGRWDGSGGVGPLTGDARQRSLSITLEATAEAVRDAPADVRLRSTLDAFRAWAISAPHRYRLIFGSTYGSGELEPDRIIPAATRSMAVLLADLAGLAPGQPGPTVDDPALRRDVEQWGKARVGSQLSEPGVLLLGLLAWSRMQGIISLEIDGFYDYVGVDPGLLFEAEIQQLIEERTR